MSATAAMAGALFLALAVVVLVAAPGFRWFPGATEESPFEFERQILRSLLLCWIICSAWGTAAAIVSLLSNHGSVNRKNMALAALLVCVLLPVAAAWLYLSSVHQALQAHFPHP
ncbi:MAG: hypothetical protein ACE5O2_05215 [Armatimonadota bacterium]